MDEDVKQNSFVMTKKTLGWRRWFRRTNVHIAEFILMLIMMGAFLGTLCALFYSAFGLAYETGYEASSLAMVAAAQLASLLIIAPAAMWLYSRTTGQEAVQPELQKRTARTVFLTIWMLSAVVTLIAIAIAAKAAAIMAIFGFDGADSFGEAFVKATLPGIFSVIVLGFGLRAVVKRPTRQNSIVSLIVLAGITVALLLATLTLAIVRKDADGTKDDKECTYARYLDKECSLSEYRQYSDSRYNNYDDYNSLNGRDSYLPGSSLY